MVLTQEFIDTLTVNEAALMKRSAEKAAVNLSQVLAVLSLLAEGSTPFIARYHRQPRSEG
ncbi:MAG: hypothetical protein LBB78_08105 [Spirochaetaceae bacterium]|jgi:uncharacterized protein|nr:hypothetical protein [Spirochaetaceae bacterium]